MTEGRHRKKPDIVRPYVLQETSQTDDAERNTEAELIGTLQRLRRSTEVGGVFGGATYEELGDESAAMAAARNEEPDTQRQPDWNQVTPRLGVTAVSSEMTRGPHGTPLAGVKPHNPLDEELLRREFEEQGPLWRDDRGDR